MSEHKRVLIVEDEAPIRRGVADALRVSGYQVTEAADGEKGLEEAVRQGVDLVLLDLLLPKKDGLDVLGQIRKVRPTLPVIILTARGSEEDRIKGLKMGADDYVVKPFSARELLARVEAVLRRSVDRPSDVKTARFSGTTVDFSRREIRRAGSRQRPEERDELSETESALLSFLLSNRQRAVSRDELLTRLWGIGTKEVETRTIDMHIARLRAKLQEEAIVTVRGQGYMAGAGWEVE